MKFSNTLVYVPQELLLQVTEKSKFLQSPFCIKMDKSLVKGPHFGHLSSIKMVPKPLNGAVSGSQASRNLSLMQLDALISSANATASSSL